MEILRQVNSFKEKLTAKPSKRTSTEGLEPPTF